MPDTNRTPTRARLVAGPSAIGVLFDALRARGYAVVGPVATPTAVVFAPVEVAANLPAGCRSQQAPGHYRVERSEDPRLFAYGPCAESPKRYLHPPVATLWRATRTSGTLRFEAFAAPARPTAIIGVRPCDLAAIERLDAVFLKGPYTDPLYAARRAALFLVAANCTEPAGTCFCASTGTGPAATAGFDVALTELPAEGGALHRLMLTAGSDDGERLVRELPGRPPSADEIETERRLLERSAARMGRSVTIAGLAAALTSAPEHPGWKDVAERCLACANCTMVCPTCFCNTTEDSSDLSGDRMERRRRWDSCFTSEFSHIHGGSVRSSVRARYRQWLTHKFATWIEQFGETGCVGCGRCVTWCPAGIDVTREIGRLHGAETNA